MLALIVVALPITTIGFVPCTPVLYRALKCLTLKGRPQLRHLHVGERFDNEEQDPTEHEACSCEDREEPADAGVDRDLIFALIFLAQLGAFIAIAVISLRALPASESTGGTRW
jgi:hypothetical protein